MEAFLCNNSLDVVNRGVTPTLANDRFNTVIDLTITTNDFCNYITNWKVSPQKTFSDHKMICFSFETSVPEDRYRLNTNDGNMKKIGELTDISGKGILCLLYTSPSPRDGLLSRMPSSA